MHMQICLWDGRRNSRQNSAQHSHFTNLYTFRLGLSPCSFSDSGACVRVCVCVRVFVNLERKNASAEEAASCHRQHIYVRRAIMNTRFDISLCTAFNVVRARLAQNGHIIRPRIIIIKLYIIIILIMAI